MNQHTYPQPTYSERIVLDDGDHVTLTVEDPNYVEVRGRIAGETFDISLRSDAADGNGYLLINGNTPDALWNLEPGRARRFGHAMIGAAAAARDAAPEADGREDGRSSDATPTGARVSDATYPSSERIALDGGHADIDLAGEHVEVSVRIGDRAGLGIALSADEAARIGAALTAAAHRAHVAQAAHIDLEGVETVTDLFRRSQESGIPASALIEMTR